MILRWQNVSFDVRSIVDAVTSRLRSTSSQKRYIWGATMIARMKQPTVTLLWVFPFAVWAHWCIS